MQIKKVEFEIIEEIRKIYLIKLAEFQELYVEMMLESSNFYAIYGEQKIIGYIIVNKDNALIEYHLLDEYIPKCTAFFEQIIKEIKISNVICKSFDYMILKCCLTFSISYEIIGTLYRNYQPSSEIEFQKFQTRLADESDYEMLLSQEAELYESPEELQYFIKGKNITMFLSDNELVGCGYLIQVHRDWNYYDIGMWTNPKFRNQGVATYIISYLKDLCINSGFKPICGCAISNIASQKTLEKNGFYSKHNLIDFKIENSKI